MFPNVNPESKEERLINRKKHVAVINQGMCTLLELEIAMMNLINRVMQK